MSQSEESELHAHGHDALGLDPAALPPSAVAILRRVAPTSAPILLLDCCGPPFARVAGAVHRSSGRPQLLAVDLREKRAGSLAAALDEARGARQLTLALDGVEHLGEGGQEILCNALEECPIRLISASTEPLEALRGSWRADRFAVLSTVTLRVPTLSRRRDEIPELARGRLGALSGVLGRPVPRLSEAAAEALAGYAWPGDLTELDAVLLRTLLVLDGETIDARDLCWQPDLSLPVRPAHPPAAGAPALEPAGAGAPMPGTPEISTYGHSGNGVIENHHPADDRDITVEALAVELAHQLKNPMVTVKTFAQNSARLAADEEAFRRFRSLTEEAIERMDSTLDELLEFSRIGPARKEPVELVAILKDALRETWSTLAGKQVSVAGPDGVALRISSDAGHLRFALRTLARHVVETIEARSDLEIALAGSGGLVLRYRQSGAITHLRGATGADGACLPLALLMVRGAITSADGRLDVATAGDDVTIGLTFPATALLTERAEPPAT
ncbi:MAG TPA: histidine kinase dimerization/phospho-acceptor domain-containing protein [Candidatus Bathyarchaeia archaeon]|nr:histidine kinase dimerization/phospho-acceptor domain-containing protein [Candidatus Bathyarchaeia archaeon]